MDNIFSLYLKAGEPRCKPMRVDWQVQGKCGRGWTELGIYSGLTDLAAAQTAFLAWNFKTVRVRAADELGVRDRWRRFKFVRRKRETKKSAVHC